MNKQNLHIHTTYVDGKNTLEELIIAAINRGFDSIGFSEHSFVKYSLYPNQLTTEKTNEYKTEIRSLKEKYKGKIGVFCGLEYEYYSDVSTDGFDYIISSVHYLKDNQKVIGFDKGVEETVSFINESFDGNSLKLAQKYFETVSLIPTKINCDILGHFDLITKNNEKGNFIDTSAKEYLNSGFEAIHNLKGKIPLFEVNTGAISRRYRTSPYPQTDFIKEFKNCGYGAVITTDCHDKNHIDCFYEESKELLKICGYKSHWILEENGFKEVSL